MREIPTDLPAPFGRYRLLKLLGQGGMGSVYLAHDTQLDRPVALKIPLLSPEEGSKHLERFYREARAAAALHHPNICPVHDVGEIDGIPYLTMAYIEGKPLTTFAAGPQSLTPRQAALLVRKLALALAEAHKRGVVHRDLKPANVMIDRRSEPIVMDFGLARRRRPGDTRLTQKGEVMGTPAYMPPEQVSGDLEAMGPACDVYSLGVILYELLAGRLPFEGDVMALLSQVLLDEPPPPSKFRPDLDPDLEAICLKAMAKKVPNRFASMTDLAAALTEYLRGKTGTSDAAPTMNQEPKPVSVAPPRASAEPPTEAHQPGFRVSALGGLRSVTQLAAQTPAKKTQDKPPRRRARTSKSRRGPRWLLIAGGIGVALLLLLVAGGVILWEVTNYGTIRIQTSRPSAEARLRVDGQPHPWGEQVRLRAGEHDLEADGNGFEPVHQKFSVRRGNNDPVQVSLPAVGPPPRKGEEVRQIQWHSGYVYGVALSPDGRYYLAGGDRITVRVWSVETGLEVLSFPGFIADFTPDSQEIVTGLRAQSAFSVRRISGGEIVKEFKGEEDLDNFWMVPKSNRLTTASKSGLSLLTLSGETRKRWDCNVGKTPVLFTPDGKHILMRKDGGPWQAFDAATGMPAPGFANLSRLEQLDGFTSDSQRVYAIRGNKLVFFDVHTGSETQTLDLGEAAFFAMSLSADPKRLLVAHKDRTIRLWDVSKGQELCRFSTPNFDRIKPNQLTISADGRYACAGGGAAPAKVYLWRLP
jgi:serine/threonine protein kinase/WD40 repeat protein